MAKKIAIITGASSGLGREFVHETVKQYPDLDEIWVIARRKNRLDELAKKYPGKIRALPWDLSKMETFDKLDELLKSEKPNVKLLVDDAGVMAIGNIADISLTEQANIVDVNARAYLAWRR